MEENAKDKQLNAHNMIVTSIPIHSIVHVHSVIKSVIIFGTNGHVNINVSRCKLLTGYASCIFQGRQKCSQHLIQFEFFQNSVIASMQTRKIIMMFVLFFFYFFPTIPEFL